MKNIEYFYNVIYYFFYRGFIKSSSIISVPMFALYKIIYKIPTVKKRFQNKGIDDPLEWHKQKYKNEILENPKLSFGTIIGGGISISVLATIYLGTYHIVRNLFFPTFEDSFGYTLAIVGILAYLTDNILVVQRNYGKEYIKEFNKKNGWWRVKWSIITALTPFIAIWFSISTSNHGMIGQYLLSLSGNYTYPTAQEKLEQENRMKLIKSGEIKIQPIDVE